MKTKDIIKNIKEYLEKDDFEAIDELIYEIYSEEMSEEQEEKIWDLLDEVTLYSELREAEYKEAALELLSKL